MKNKTFTVSLESIYEKYGESLEYGEIRKTVDGEQDYYDLYSDEALVCMDGESCRIININDDNVLLRNNENDEVFLLSTDEFNVGCFTFNK